ncbi:hypothetical protein G4O51_12490 [Candidatus Bathyarchaeota archaeon A05DMB-2]|nr:hypothetical protein [Candidatus Bathyarchaeota archaeon A05DMB-2]
MSLYISYLASDTARIKMYLSLLNRALRAYITICPATAILSVYGREIYYSTTLKEYFHNNLNCEEWLEWYHGYNFNVPWYATPQALAMWLYNCVRALIPAVQTLNIATTLTGQFTAWQEIVEELSGIEDKNTNEVVDYINSTMKAYIPTPPEGYADPAQWKQINPFIDVDWTVIKSFIVLYQAYSRLSTLDDPSAPVMPYVKGQRVDVWQDGRLTDPHYLDAEGRVAVDLPAESRALKLDSFGLTCEISLPVHYLERFKIWVRDTSTWIYSYEETWVKKSREPPDWDVLGFEDQKGMPNPDWDFDDLIVKCRIEDGRLHVKIYNGTKEYTHDVYYMNTYLCTAPQNDSGNYILIWDGYLDPSTGTIL